LRPGREHGAEGQYGAGDIGNRFVWSHGVVGKFDINRA
jgi:hypothetical protein